MKASYDRLFKGNDEWIKEKLPEIYEEHIKNGWRIFYQDEVGFQTEGTLSYSWGEKGKPIPIKNKGRHRPTDPHPLAVFVSQSMFTMY